MHDPGELRSWAPPRIFGDFFLKFRIFQRSKRKQLGIFELTEEANFTLTSRFLVQSILSEQK